MNIFELIRSDFIDNGVRSTINQIQVDKHEICVIIDTEGKLTKLTESEFIEKFEEEEHE